MFVWKALQKATEDSERGQLQREFWEARKAYRREVREKNYEKYSTKWRLVEKLGRSDPKLF